MDVLYNISIKRIFSENKILFAGYQKWAEK